ncbi:MAG: hypothetical protein ACFFAN_02855 [Promethearchaeota archaeon]
MEESKQSKKKYKYNFIQFSVSDAEKKEIEKFVEKSPVKTITDFVRQAVFEKIRNIKHPQLNSTNQSNSIDFKILIEKINKIGERQKIMQENLSIINQMDHRLALIQKYSAKNDLTNETKTVMSLFKSHKSLSIKEIIDLTKMDDEIIFSIINQLRESIDNLKPKIKMNSNGRFQLNE